MHSRFASLFILLSIFFLSDATMPFKTVQVNNQQIQDFFPAKMVNIQRQTSPGNVPVVNPTIPGTTPAVNPTNGPTTTTPSGRAWCIASSNASPTALQVGLDYACGYSGADCSAIQPGGPCYDPNTVRDHASYAFNSYYQRNPVPTSCDFGGAARLSNTDPSYGNCRFASSTNTIPNPPAYTMPNPPANTMPNPPANTMPNPPANTLPNPPTIPMAPPSTTTNPFIPGGSSTEPAGNDYGNEPPSSAHSISRNLELIAISSLMITITLFAHHF